MNVKLQGFRDLPSFTADGVLPPADYEITLEELRESMLVRGPSDCEAYPNWDVAHRRMLVDNLGIMVQQLESVGIETIYVDGSFVEDKDRPHDIDGYF
jgi:hypothetical protein